jgi:hypothetical protein
MTWLAPLLLVAVQAELVAVRVEPVGSRHALVVVASGAIGEVGVTREGSEVVVRLRATAADDLSVPAPAGPIDWVAIERLDDGVEVRARVAPGIPYEVRRQERSLTLVFGETDGSAKEGATSGEEARGEGAPPPSTAELYRRLFPVAVTEAAPPTVEEGALGAGGEGGGSFGPFRVRPGVIVSYLDTSLPLEEEGGTAHDRFLQVQPRVELSSTVPLALARLTLDYAPRFRFGSTHEIIGRTSHLATARLDWPLGTRMELNARHHFAWGTLEADEVDPGREYYYDLGRFKRNSTQGALRLDASARVALLVGGSYERIRFEEQSAFFDYEIEEAHATLRYELGTRTKLGLRYLLHRVPPNAARPVVEAQSQGGEIELSGDLSASTQVNLRGGYWDYKSPNATQEGNRYQGLVAGAVINRSIGRLASLSLAGMRSVLVSAFEGNAFYVSTGGQAQLAIPLVAGFAVRGGTGYYFNSYETDATGVGAPREDRIRSWSAGLSKSFGRRLFLGADYRRERRTSNVSRFTHESEALIIQLGAGHYGAAVSR